jgi:hypothetical protein
MTPDRRAVLGLLAGTSAALALPACAGAPRRPVDTPADPPGDDTAGGDSGRPDSGGVDSGGPPDCGATAADIEGPYYTPGAPEVAALADDEEPGRRIVILGQVVDPVDCSTPRVGWAVDLWHADDGGNYDNTGFHLRGKVVTDADGRFVVETVLPGRYDSRPVRHIHFKVWDTEGVARLTSQIYFAGDDAYRPEAHPGPVVDLDDASEGALTLFV